MKFSAQEVNFLSKLVFDPMQLGLKDCVPYDCSDSEIREEVIELWRFMSKAMFKKHPQKEGAFLPSNCDIKFESRLLNRLRDIVEHFKKPCVSQMPQALHWQEIRDKVCG